MADLSNLSTARQRGERERDEEEMGIHGIQLHYYYCSFLFLLLLWGIGRARALSRDDFPAGFTFGAGTSALQVEGAITEDGRKPSIWDYFLRSGKMADKSNADIAADQYHKYKEDVKLMHEMGLDAYRFSIAWPRLIPDGRGAINPKGLQYYNNLIDELISYGIEPHVTIYHFDLPHALQDEYKGLLSPKIIDDYTAYADVCFREFGDRVKNWITVNEPNVESLGGYDQGVLPPERCSYPFGFHSCDEGNSTTEPYIVAYHLLLAHASAVSLYREKYQVTQGGKIGLTLLGLWFEPYTQSPEDIAATKRMIDFHIGWFVHPLVYGTYPDIMRKNVGSRLPSFTEEEANKIKGSFDFIGFNHYLVSYVQSDLSSLSVEMRDYYQDAAVKIPALTTFSNKGFEGMPVEPWALQKMLEHLKVKYQNPPVVIHENGDGEAVDPKNAGTSYNDEFRANFIHAYMKALLLSIKNGSNAQGYFVWSFIDAFEFLFGYSGRYGLVGVDFNDKNRKRYRRYSGDWYSNFLKGNGIKKIASANASAAA